MHVNREAGAEGARRYITPNPSGRIPRAYINWNTDIIMISENGVLQGLFSPENVEILSPATRIGISDNIIPEFLNQAEARDSFSAVEELYVIRQAQSIYYGEGYLELTGNTHSEDYLTDFLEFRHMLKIAVVADAVRDANRWLQGKEKRKRDKRRAAKR
jgi:hypothetical protein